MSKQGLYRCVLMPEPFAGVVDSMVWFVGDACHVDPAVVEPVGSVFINCNELDMGSMMIITPCVFSSSSMLPQIGHRCPQCFICFAVCEERVAVWML